MKQVEEKLQEFEQRGLNKPTIEIKKIINDEGKVVCLVDITSKPKSKSILNLKLEHSEATLEDAITACLDIILNVEVEVEDNITVPINPPDSLLLSMAIRYDHGLGVPGYYDMLGAGEHQKRLNSTLTVMRQLHQEVVGKGFYHEGYQPPMSLDNYSIKLPENLTSSPEPILNAQEVSECIESACSDLCDSEEPCSLTPTGDCYLRINRTASAGLEESQVKSMQSLAKQLRARGGDLSNDAASWLEKFSGQQG